MVTESFLKASATLGIIGGLMLGVPGLVEIGTGETAATSLILGLGAGPAMALLPALYFYVCLSSPTVSGASARLNAYLANLVGLALFGAAGYTLNVALFFLDQPDLEELLEGPTRFALLGSALVFAVGTVAFGVTMIRSGAFPASAAWGYTVLLPIFAVAAGLPDSAITGLLHGLVGLVLVVLALRIRSGAPVAAASLGATPVSA
jgi:hypothetical protein